MTPATTIERQKSNQYSKKHEECPRPVSAGPGWLEYDRQVRQQHASLVVLDRCTFACIAARMLIACWCRFFAFLPILKNPLQKTHWSHGGSENALYYTTWKMGVSKSMNPRRVTVAYSKEYFSTGTGKESKYLYLSLRLSFCGFCTCKIYWFFVPELLPWWAEAILD